MILRPLALLPLLPFALVLGSCAPQPSGSAGSSSHSSIVAESSGAPSTDLPEGTFGISEGGSFYGEFYVRGYPRIERVNEAFCEQNCKQFDYVFFQVQETANKEFENFLKTEAGNSYVGPGSIGLGCRETNGTIRYWNDSDELGMQEFTLTPELSRTILNATAESPVTLKLDRLLYNGGRGAPDCYAHITRIAEWHVSAGGKQSPDGCMRSGCSGQLCVDVNDAEPVMTDCQIIDAYACYQAAECKRQDNGACGWTQTDELLSCLAAS